MAEWTEDEKDMAKKYDHKKEQAKTYKWWQANKEIVRLRIINNFDLPNNFKV